jgi:hypothetical protein
MNRNSHFSAAIAVAAAYLLAGCVSGQTDYSPPTAKVPKDAFSKTLNKTKDVVWASTVPALGKDFFVINNLDKGSGLINVSYSGDPHDFIDCGHISGFFSNARGRQDYSFDASTKDAQYTLWVSPVAGMVDRHMNLDGRVNIIFESLTPDTTKVTVNARYIVDRHAHMVGFDGRQGNNDNQIAFISTSQGNFPPSADGRQTVCVATGKLERDILNLIQ